MFASTVQAEREQYACFSHPKMPPLKVTIDGTTVTLDHPGFDVVPAHTQTIDFLRLPLDAAAQRFIGKTNKSPCTLIQNTYQLGLISTSYCWKESTRELFLDRQHFERDEINDSRTFTTTLYDCVAVD